MCSTKVAVFGFGLSSNRESREDSHSSFRSWFICHSLPEFNPHSRPRHPFLSNFLMHILFYYIPLLHPMPTQDTFLECNPTPHKQTANGPLLIRMVTHIFSQLFISFLHSLLFVSPFSHTQTTSFINHPSSFNP